MLTVTNVAFCSVAVAVVLVVMDTIFSCGKLGLITLAILVTTKACNAASRKTYVGNVCAFIGSFGHWTASWNTNGPWHSLHYRE